MNEILNKPVKRIWITGGDQVKSTEDDKMFLTMGPHEFIVRQYKKGKLSAIYNGRYIETITFPDEDE
jgi:hypothetical protein